MKVVIIFLTIIAVVSSLPTKNLESVGTQASMGAITALGQRIPLPITNIFITLSSLFDKKGN